MRWNEKASFQQGVESWVTLKNKKKRIEEEDLVISEMMKNGITDDSELLLMLSEETGQNSIMAGLRLAQFVEDYGEFLAEGTKEKVFGI